MRRNEVVGVVGRLKRTAESIGALYAPYVLLVLLAWGASAARAEDVVTVAASEGRGDSRYRGEIVEYTGRELILRQTGEREVTISSSRVAGIETTWPASYVQAQALLPQRQREQALELLQTALREEQRRWARREILAEMVSCYASLDRAEDAARTFALIAEDDPSTRAIARAPLAWTSQRPSPSLAQLCSAWMNDVAGPPALRLLGASWLLASDSRAAVDVLRRLSADSDPRVAQLAAAQLWRTRIAEASPADSEQWATQIERMDAEIRGGPYVLLGQALARLNQHEDAALALLRAPFMYGQLLPALSAEALLAAGKEMEKAGQRDEATVLFRETAERYGESLAGREAAIRLQNLSDEP